MLEAELKLKIVLQSPPPGVDFGLQKGSGNNYETIQIQRSGIGDLQFELNIKVKDKGGVADFFGPFVHGPVGERFIYIDIGVLAGQRDSIWQRRLKVPLRGISMDMVSRLQASLELILETHVAGTAKDGSPNCATVKPFAGWLLCDIKD